jgi:hypothetical protein
VSEQPAKPIIRKTAIINDDIRLSLIETLLEVCRVSNGVNFSDFELRKVEAYRPMEAISAPQSFVSPKLFFYQNREGEAKLRRLPSATGFTEGVSDLRKQEKFTGCLEQYRRYRICLTSA